MFNVKAHCSKLPEFGEFALENPTHEAEQMFLLEDIKALVATRATVLPRGIVIFYLLKNSRTQQSGYELDSKMYFVGAQKEQNHCISLDFHKGSGDWEVACWLSPTVQSFVSAAESKLKVPQYQRQIINRESSI